MESLHKLQTDTRNIDIVFFTGHCILGPHARCIYLVHMFNVYCRRIILISRRRSLGNPLLSQSPDDPRVRYKIKVQKYKISTKLNPTEICYKNIEKY